MRARISGRIPPGDWSQGAISLIVRAAHHAAIKHLTASKFDHANNSKYTLWCGNGGANFLARRRAVINLSANNSFY